MGEKTGQVQHVRENSTPVGKEHISGSAFTYDNYISCYYFFFFAVALRPNAGHGLLILQDSRSHTTKHHSR